MPSIGAKILEMKEQDEFFVRHVKPHLERKRREREEIERRQHREEFWMALAFVVAVLGMVLMDGYAVAHGQTPMLFGK